MADMRFSDWTLGLAAAGALTGTETAPVVLGAGVTERATVDDWVTYAGGLIIPASVAATLADPGLAPAVVADAAVFDPAAAAATFADAAWAGNVQAEILAYLAAGANITLTPAPGSLTIAASGGGGSGAQLWPDYQAGRNYNVRLKGTATANGTLVANTVYYFPCFIWAAGTFDRFTVATGGSVTVSGNVICGFYDDSAGLPGNKLFETASFATSGSTNTASQAAPTAAMTISTPGNYWLAVVADAALTTMASIASADIMAGTAVGSTSAIGSITGTGQGVGYSQAAGGFALPAAASGLTVVTGTIIPSVGLRAA